VLSHARNAHERLRRSRQQADEKPLHSKTSSSLDSLHRSFHKSQNVARLLLERLPGQQPAEKTSLQDVLFLLREWRRARMSLPSLLKLAEVLPVADLACFALHVTRGHYALALRTVVKTEQAEVKVRRFALKIDIFGVLDFTVQTIALAGVKIQPVSSMTIGAIADMAKLFLKDVKKSGSKRRKVSQAIRKSTQSKIKSVRQIKRKTTSDLLKRERTGLSRAIIARSRCRTEAPAGPMCSFGSTSSTGSSEGLHSNDLMLDAVQVEDDWDRCDESLSPSSWSSSSSSSSSDLDADTEDGFRLGHIKKLKQGLADVCTESVLESLRSLLSNMPQHLDTFATTMSERRLPELRSRKWSAWLFLPRQLPSCSAEFTSTLQDAVGNATIAHCDAVPAANSSRCLLKLSLKARMRNALSLATTPAVNQRRSRRQHVGGCFDGLARAAAMLCQSFSGGSGKPAPVGAAKVDGVSMVSGVWLELQPLDTKRVEEGLAEYLLEAYRWNLPMQVVRRVAPLMRRYLSRKSIPASSLTPLLVPVEVPEQEVQCCGLQLELPAFPLILQLDSSPATHGRWIERVQIAISDAVLDSILESIRTQLCCQDLRVCNERLAGFPAPLCANFQAALKWPLSNSAELELSEVDIQLPLPT